MKKFVRILAAAICSALMAASLAACNSNSGSSSKPAEDSKPASAADAKTESEDEKADEPDLGFTEVPIFEDVEKEFLNLTAVYFQAVDMTGGYKA